MTAFAYYVAFHVYLFTTIVSGHEVLVPLHYLTEMLSNKNAKVV